MNPQLHSAQKISKKSLKLAEIDLFHSNAKIGFFLMKKTKIRKKPAPRFKIFDLKAES